MGRKFRPYVSDNYSIRTIFAIMRCKNREEQRRMIVRFVFCCWVIFFACPAYTYSQENTYPAKNRLFHIERSLNRNLVCYDVNVTGGKPDRKEPLNVYWVNREKEPGKISGLNAIQKRYAYGYALVSQEEESFKITLKAHKNKILTVRKQGQTYVCVTEIDNQPAILRTLYVKSKESNSLKVEYVELRGIGMESGKPLTERIINK